ncbi:HAD-IA family hydrolase [soil metagenome]
MPVTLSARAILFDMDGTLLESSAAVTRVWTEFADRFGLSIDEIMATSHGVRMAETVQRYAPEGTDVAAVVADLSDWELHDNDGVVALDGAAGVLAALPPTAVALVTSASHLLATARMDAANLPLPAVMVTAEDVDHGKPRPDCYLLAAERLGVDASDTIVFEDADAGVRAGLAAGATVVVVGDLVSEATAGLLRVPHYGDVTVGLEGDRVVVTL